MQKDLTWKHIIWWQSRTSQTEQYPKQHNYDNTSAAHKQKTKQHFIMRVHNDYAYKDNSKFCAQIQFKLTWGRRQALPLCTHHVASMHGTLLLEEVFTSVLGQAIAINIATSLDRLSTRCTDRHGEYFKSSSAISHFATNLNQICTYWNQIWHQQTHSVPLMQRALSSESVQHNHF